MYKLLIPTAVALILFSCSSNDDNYNKDCNCVVQQYKRTVLTKKNSDGTFSPYSDTGWNKNGQPDKDVEKDCSKNDQIKQESSQTDSSSEFVRDIHLKWVYSCS